MSRGNYEERGNQGNLEYQKRNSKGKQCLKEGGGNKDRLCRVIIQ